MIYGRRFFEKTAKPLSPHERRAEQLHRSQQSMQSLYQYFQRKYSWYFVFALVGPLAVFSLPCIYFLQQNYNIFSSLAYDVRPDLLNHLDREINVLIGLIVFAVSLSGIFCYWLTKRLTNLIIGPIWMIEKHMKKITSGDWSAEDFRAPYGAEFQSLTGTYSYLYRTLRALTQKEIEALEALQPDPQDRNSSLVLKALITTKKAQLGLLKEPPLSDASAVEISSFPATRHAS